MIDSITIILKDFALIKDWRQEFDGTRVTEIKNRFTHQCFFPKSFNERRKKAGKYFPQLTLDSKKHELQIQISLPKFLFGTNLLEIDETYLNQIYEKLTDELKRVGVNTTPQNIANSPLKRIDFCKNFQIPHWLGTSKQLIWKMSELGKKRSSDSRLSSFSQENNKEGILLKFWNTTQGYAIYDKPMEILSNGYTNIEKAIQENIISDDYEYNIIRFELSLQKKQSLEAFLRRKIDNKKKDFHLRDVLKKELVKNILLEVFNETFKPEELFILSLAEMKENELERYLLQQNLKLSEHTFLSYWINKTIRNGLPATLQEFKNRTSVSTVNRHKKEFKKLSDKFNITPSSTHNIASYFREKHQEFKILKPSNHS